ncbi:sensor histidine kinase [Undibacterium sp. Xuan67W]|uniref:sensor histidine kinase n=1 Tax=Undibacterium sp. Xuan67W TaxID=3413057 RepID=UPI003BF11FF0
MTLSRLDPHYSHDPKLQKINLGAFLSNHLNEIKKMTEKNAIVLTTQLDDAICLINTDSMMILVRNLIDNAARYTPTGSKVNISCGVFDNRVFLRIADSGPGIPVDMREKVFERFFRLQESTPPGSGLGLSIVKNIAATHRAEIKLSDGIEGLGIAITIFLQPLT